MITTYDFIDDNRRKTILLVCLFPISLIAMLYFSFFIIAFIYSSFFYSSVVAPINYSSSAVNANLPLIEIFKDLHNSYYPLIIIIFLFSIIWTIISFYSGQKFIMSFANARPADTIQDKEIIRLVENIAITAGLPMPQVHIMYDNSLHAFATGRDPNNAHIVLTTGIIDKLEKSELEGVIAHEMAHINNRDTRLMMILILLIGFFTFVGSFIIRLGFGSSNRRSSRNSKGSGGALILIVIGIVLYVYGIIVAPLIRLAISRRREYQADAKAALITRNPQGLISALRKISGHSAIRSFQGKEIMSPMCIGNPLTNESSLFGFLSDITSTHPPIEKRIAALEVMDGIKVNY